MPQVIGLDVGSRSVKVAVFERGFRGLELSSFSKRDFDPGDPEGLSRALDSVSGEINAQGATVCARIPGDRVLLRFLDFPMADARKLEQVVPFEVESQVPFELDDLIVDHSIVRKNDAGGSRVLVGAARRDDVRNFLPMLSAKGLEPRYLGAGPSALASLATAVPALAHGTVVLVDAGFTRTDICVLDEGKVVYARTVSGGGADLADAHVAGGGVADEVAGFDVGGTELKTAAGRAAAEFVTREVKRTLFAAEIEAKVEPSRIVLFGGLSRQRGFAALMERQCQLPVEALALASSDWAAGKMGEGQEAEAGAAVALAFRVLADGAQAGVNFRRDEFAFRRDSIAITGVVSRVLVAVLALIVLGCINYVVKERLLAGERAFLDGQILGEVMATFPDIPRASLTSTDKAISIMRGEINSAQQRLDQLGGGSASALEVLRELSAAVPDGVYIDVKRLELEEGKVKMTCLVESYEAGERLVEGFKKVSIFKNVTSRDDGSEAGKKRIQFTLDVAPVEGGDS